MTSGFQRIVQCLVLITIGLFSLHVGAQEGAAEGDEQTSADAEILERLEQEKKEWELRAAIEEARKRIAEAESATIDARAGETEALGGDVTLNKGAGYFSEVLAYQALQKVASDIAASLLKKLSDYKNEKIIVVGDADLSAEIALWELTFSQIERLETRQDDFLEKYATDEPVSEQRDDFLEKYATDEPVSDFFRVIVGRSKAKTTAESRTASALVSSVADLVGYFREDTELTKYSITLSESALLAKVVAEIKKKDKDRAIFMPTRSIDVGGDLFQKLADVAEQRLKLLERNKAIQSEAVRSKEAQQNEAVQSEEAQQRLELLENYAKQAKSEIESVTGAVASLLEQLTTPGEQGAVAPLQTLSYVDKLKAYSDDVFLSVAIAGQGGEVQITRSIWTGGRISYIGGATCTYYATKASGELIAAGTFSSYQKAAYGQRRGVSGLK